MTERKAEPTNRQHRGSTGNGGTRALFRTLAYLRSYKRETFAAFLALLLASAANLITPQLIAYAVDSGIEARRLKVILLAVGGLVTVALSQGLFTFLQGYLAERASQGVAYDLRNTLFTKIERLSFSYYDRVETGQLVTRRRRSAGRGTMADRACHR